MSTGGVCEIHTEATPNVSDVPGSACTCHTKVYLPSPALSGAGTGVGVGVAAAEGCAAEATCGTTQRRGQRRLAQQGPGHGAALQLAAGVPE